MKDNISNEFKIIPFKKDFYKNEKIAIGPQDVSEIARNLNSQLPVAQPSCDTIVTIPVYKEFQSGRIRNLLDELTNQSVPVSLYEVILVVNNPTYKDGKLYNPQGLQDNLQLMQYVKEQQAQGKLNNIRVLDCTNGLLPARHLGLVRGLGNEVAYHRLSTTSKGTDGIIIQLDADTSIDKDFIEKIRKYYSEHPEIDCVGIGRSVLPAIEKYVGDDYYLGMSLEFFDNIKALITSEGGIILGGPQISMKAKLQVFEPIREYMEVKNGEDLLLSIELQQYARLGFTTEPRVFVEDRIRPEGYDANMRNFYTRIEISYEKFNKILNLTLPGLTFTKEEFSGITFDKITEVVLNKLQVQNPKLAEKLEAYYQQELKTYKSRAKNQNTNSPRVTFGALIFALSRLISE